MSADSTHPSLLSRLRNRADQSAWREFDARYGDLVVRYACRRGLQHSDAEDVRQLVMISLFNAMPQFEYSPARGRFRSYLGQVTRRAVNHFLQRDRPTRHSIPLSVVGDSVAQQDATPPDELWDAEWINHHFRIAMRTVRATYDPQSVDVFQRLLDGRTVREVALDLDMTEPAVNKVKQRVRDRLRSLIAAQVREEDESPQAMQPS